MNDTSGVIAGLLEDRAGIIQSADPGSAAARRLADATDKAVSVLAEAAFAGMDARWAVIAVGAYGAGRSLPFSDIDLLVLCDVPARRLKPHVERLLYPLWDTGLEIGHQVRSRGEHLKQCAADVEILTASLTGRWVAGDPVFARGALDDVARRAARRRGAVLEALVTRPRPGSPFLLEPDLKEGAGGQRDIDELVWRAALTAGTPVHDVSGASTHGVIAPDLLAAAEKAQDALTAARWRLHKVSGRKSSRVTLDVAETVAEPGLHGAMAVIASLVDTARDSGDPDPGTWDADRLFAALQEGPRSLPSLGLWAARGALDTLVPGLSEMMVLRRPGLAHRYTVGAHMLRAATLVAVAGDEDAIARGVLTDTHDRRPLMVAALTHDAGKTEPGPGHAQRSVPLAEQVAAALGLSERDTGTVATLVREHLLLAETAATRDPHDDDVVFDVAARVGDTATLGQLYVLTVVDSLATGPGAWSRWHAALVGDLLGAVDLALREPEAATIADRAQVIRIEALELLPSGSPLAGIIRSMHYRYLVTRTPHTVVSDAGIVDAVRKDRAAAPLSYRVGPGPVPETYHVTVSVPDRTGIFATVAGCLTLAGLDIMDAEAHAFGGVALDAFMVGSATSAPVEPTVWSRFERELKAALAGNLALETRLEERRAHYAGSERSDRVRVDVDTDSARATTVRVTAPDRVGLLHDIAAEMTRAGLTIVRVRAIVRDGMAVDTFVVTDADDDAPRDPGLLGHLAMGIRERCA